jgi:hypothetical protein
MFSDPMKGDTGKEEEIQNILNSRVGGRIEQNRNVLVK